jgi:CRISPR-associated protein Cas4
MQDKFAQFFLDTLYDLAQADTQLVLLAVLCVCTSIVLDVVSSFAKQKKKASGIGKGQKAIAVDSQKKTQTKEYISEIQGLAGRPDALLFEHGKIIPVERKPMSNKIRDRSVAQLLVYMRLIEEFEGIKPPYGYLILGKNCRRVRIENTPARQAWLQSMLDEMRAHLEDGKPVQPAPAEKKCRNCKFQAGCAIGWSAEPPGRLTKKVFSPN